MDKKKQIIKYLEKEGLSPTSKIALMVGVNYYLIEKLLGELKKDKIVTSNKMPKGLYWELK